MIRMSWDAIQQKLTEHCKSTVIKKLNKKKKNGMGTAAPNTLPGEPRHKEW